MKYLYTTPEIKVEELTKADVLCSSGEEAAAPIINGTYNVEDSAKGWSLEDFL